MIEKINTMFHANVNRFPPASEGHKQTRDILLERELSGKDLDKFSHVKQSQIEQAANASGLDKELLATLLARLEERGHNEMANVIKEFIGTHGFQGISAIHILLDGSCRNLVIRTESNTYVDPVNKAITLEAKYTATGSEHDDRTIINLTADSSSRSINEFFSEMSEAISTIDQALKDLWEDPLFEGQDDLLKFSDSNLREKKGNLRSKLLAAKNRLLDMCDLEKQGFPTNTIERIYHEITKSKRTSEQTYTLLAAKYRNPISMHDSREDITKRWLKVKALLARISSELSALDTAQQKKILGIVYVVRTTKKLQLLRTKAQELMVLNHLVGSAQAFIDMMSARPWHLFPVNPDSREIATEMEKLRNSLARGQIDAELTH
jgi:hypothetical protein